MVLTPGNSVPVTRNQFDPSVRVPCQSILIQALSNGTHTNSGRIYVLDEMKRRVATLSIPTEHSAPSFSATIPNAPQALNAAEYHIDADVAGDGVDVSIVRL